jgi:DedD protein
MRGTFDDRELEPVRQHSDTELTLSTTTLLGIFFGLVLLCGLCFGLGYSVGRRGNADLGSGLQPEANAQTTSLADAFHPKPSARTATPAEPPPTDTTTVPPGTDDGPIPPTGVQPAQSPAVPAATPIQPQVRPALPPATTTAQPMSPLSPVGAAGTLMVQVAAVSNQEDADVLTGALRKRGYPVNERRDAADGMVHVRIGPFTTRDDANKWRMKLLNDGYNAIIQP